jgi:hypothetical protein
METTSWLYTRLGRPSMPSNLCVDRFFTMLAKHTDLYPKLGTLVACKKLLGLDADLSSGDTVELMSEWLDDNAWWEGPHYEAMFVAYLIKRGLKHG